MVRRQQQIALGTCELSAVGVTACARLVRYAPGQRLAPHAHETSSITVVVQGALLETSPHATIHARVGDCIIKPAGSIHENIFGDAGVATIQLEILAGRDRMDPAENVRRCGYAHLRAGPPVGPMLALLRYLKSREPGEGVDEHAIDVLGAIASLHAPCRVRPPWLARVEREIRLAIPSRIRVAELAVLARVHPVHMARVFHARHGCGVVEYTRRLRVQWAADRLADRRSELVVLAADAGFCDQAHFTRAFREVLGVTPGEFRRLVCN